MVSLSNFFRKKETGAGNDPELQTFSSLESAGDLSGIAVDDDQLWHLTFDAMDDVISIHDTEMRCIKANRAAKELLQLDDQEIIGRTCHDLFVGSDEPCSSCPPQLTGDNKIQSSEVELVRYDTTFSVTCSPIVIDGKVKGFVRVCKNISDQKKLEKQLVQAQKMESIATLAGGIGHDFNNILGAILGNTDLLLYRIATMDTKRQKNSCERVITFPEIQEHLHSIKTAGNRAKGLIAQIQAFSRQSSSKKLDVDITPIIKETVKLLRSSLPSTIELKSNISPDVGLIHGDPTQIQQVVMNLCTNAAQAMQENGGRLTVEMKELVVDAENSQPDKKLIPGDYVMLSIRDTGTGMTEETRSRIFDPFFTTRKLGTGTGMGLAVIHGIVKNHKGIIDVQSRVGEGSFFRIYIPRLAPVDTTSDVEIVSNLARGTETILLVDDEDAILDMRSKMLEYMGYTVLTATNGLDAYTLFKEKLDIIDLVITDNTMPLMTGLQLSIEIHKFCDIPIIFCSGLSNTVSEKQAEEAGISRIFQKPLNINTLAKAIREEL